MKKSFKQLRLHYPVFEYASYEWKINHKTGEVLVSFVFHILDDNKKIFQTFKPTSTFQLSNHLQKEINLKWLDILVFSIGMVEMISYWKCTCSPIIKVTSGALSCEQETWWKKLYFFGLQEFLYLNNISILQEELFTFDVSSKDTPSFNIPIKNTSGNIIPIGGGKDSSVTLNILKDNQENNLCLIINPREASRTSAKTAGYDKKKLLIINRKIDKKLLVLNSQGFLNGHTPFSAMLAFYSICAAYLTNNKNIALSNESSADEPTIHGSIINHQYSKSLEFENDFREYVSDHISKDINYFSLLRPLNELQITNLFSRTPQYFNQFKSCNVGSKSDIWCCSCPKCLFVYIMLGSFISPSVLQNIFGENLLQKSELTEYFDQLIGDRQTKPFECVGTVQEIRASISETIGKWYKGKPLPLLFQNFKITDSDQKKYLELLKEKGNMENIPKDLLAVLGF
ncbi:MAG: hypothetical protein OEX08_02335 [Candidatus Nomurabacteria bacterium]|nr:hypothetical protein [Candidatus Nomurabacteria bacterium]